MVMRLSNGNILTPVKGLTYVDKPFQFLRVMHKIPNRINLQQFRVLTNYVALTVGNPMVSDEDVEKYFNDLRRLFGVRGNTLPKGKLVAMSKNEINKRAGLPPQGMDKSKCCKECDNKQPVKIKCNCSYNGIGYSCGGDHCSNWPYTSDCCMCSGPICYPHC